MPKKLLYQEGLLDEEAHEQYYQDELEEPDPLEPFLDDGTITEVIGEIKSGKEGTVFCCRANPSLGIDLVAAKVFRSREQRTFRNQSVYREGNVILNQRDARAVNKKTAWGRTFEEGSWKYHEFEVLKALRKAGADVPKPIKLSEHALLMEYIGDIAGAAPKLQEAAIQQYEARGLFDRVMRNIELFLTHDFVHGDLSAYNVLYWKGTVCIIDFPQTVDARTNRNALALLQRDIGNICRFFQRYGVRTDPDSISRTLWRRYTQAEL